MSKVPDPFLEKRRSGKVFPCEFQGEMVPMILAHEEVRKAAKDWKTFSSDAPFRVPIPSEESMRTMRQLPIETDPPEHTEYRAIVEPFFRRPKDPAFVQRLEEMIGGLLVEANAAGTIDLVRGFSLPLQSRALTLLLNVPESEADIWVGWGIHVFHDGQANRKGPNLEEYLNAKFDEALERPGEDFFTALTQASFRGRALTRAEMMGFANLTFAGGRDTIIHTVSSTLAYLAREPGALAFLREDPDRITLASEELFRVFMPLTHIGRVCPAHTDVHGSAVKPGGRVSLCWSSANFDETTFSNPTEIRLDRKPNPHLSFGFGTHLCLGAHHARAVLRALLRKCVEQVDSIEIVEASEKVESTSGYQRIVGYDSLLARLRVRG